jgi:hypothetical protein
MFGRGRPNQSGPLDGAGRRSIYLEVRRNFLSPMMLAFDTPLPFSTVGRRNVSNVPAQTLILMNDPFVTEQASKWAEHSLTESQRLAESASAPKALVNALFHEAFARSPTDEEREAAIDFLEHQAIEYGDSAWQGSLAAWTELCHTLFNSKEFIFIE